jgi:hypothetical protein
MERRQGKQPAERSPIALHRNEGGAIMSARPHTFRIIVAVLYRSPVDASRCAAPFACRGTRGRFTIHSGVGVAKSLCKGAECHEAVHVFEVVRLGLGGSNSARDLQ